MNRLARWRAGGKRFASIAATALLLACCCGLHASAQNLFEPRGGVFRPRPPIAGVPLLGFGLNRLRNPPRNAPPQAPPPRTIVRPIRVHAPPAALPRRPLRRAALPHPQPRALRKPAAAPAFAAIPLPPVGETRLVPGETLVLFKPATSPAQIAAFARRHALVALDSQHFDLLDRTLYRFGVGRRTPRAAVAELRRDPRVDFVQPDYHYALLQSTAATAAAAAPSIPQYADDKLEVARAHALALGRHVVVAVIDSTVDQTHDVFAASHIESLDALGRPQPPGAHGTEMVGAIAASKVLTGVSPAADVLAIAAFASGDESAAAEGDTWILLHALDLAAGRKAQIVNMSFAGPPDPLLARAIAAGQIDGMIFVAAAGNGGAASPPLYPAADSGVVAVGATDADDKPYADETRGDYVAVAAPGVDVLVPAPGGFATTTGTSVAAALVSGVMALMLEAHPHLSASDARAALRKSAVDRGDAHRLPGVAPGPIDARSALLDLPPAGSASPGSTK